jgi:hypothetical protein
MFDLTDAQAAAFFRRSYSAVDGLWFRMVEDRFGLELATCVLRFEQRAQDGAQP